MHFNYLTYIMTVYSNWCCKQRGYQKRPEVLWRHKLCLTTGKTGEQISARGNSSEWSLVWKYFTELFTPKPQAPNPCQTRSDLILVEFSSQLPFDQIAASLQGWCCRRLQQGCGDVLQGSSPCCAALASAVGFKDIHGGLKKKIKNL